MWIIHLWTGYHWTCAGKPGYTVAILSQPDWKDEEHPGVWRAASCLSGLFRKYGFYGKSLYGLQKAEGDRCVYTGRSDGKTSGQGGCLWKSYPPRLQADAGYFGRDRGKS